MVDNIFYVTILIDVLCFQSISPDIFYKRHLGSVCSIEIEQLSRLSECIDKKAGHIEIV